MNGGTGNAAGLAAVGTTLYLVDVAADVWQSTDLGATWTLVKDDYNAGAANNATYLAADGSSQLYILNNKEIWRSTDSGASWTQLTANFGGANGRKLTADSSNNLYLVDNNDDVWRSTNGGTSWTSMAANINGAAGNLEGLVTLPIAVDVTFGVRSGSTNPPTDSFAGSYTDSSGSSLSVTANRYFQYRATFN